MSSILIIRIASPIKNNGTLSASIRERPPTKIVLPKIRDKGIHRLDTANSISTHVSSIRTHNLPSVSLAHKSSNELGQKPAERHLRYQGPLAYKSLLKKYNKDQSQEYKQAMPSNRIQTSSSSANMSVQEMMLDKVYGTLERENQKYL